jgi:hypothetical protein
MTGRQFVKVFCLNPKYLINGREAAQWRRIMEDYRGYDTTRVVEELRRVVKVHGEGKARLWYVKAVWSNLRNSYNQERKKEPMPQAIKDIFKTQKPSGSKGQKEPRKRKD